MSVPWSLEDELERWEELLLLSTPDLARRALAGDGLARRILTLPPLERIFEITGDVDEPAPVVLLAEWSRREHRRRVLRGRR